MRVTVQRWGNSLAVRIPKAIALESDLAEGTPVELRPIQGGIALRQVSSRKYRLGEMLSGVTAKNTHGETGTGLRVGREEW